MGSSRGSGSARGEMTTASGMAPSLQRSAVAGTLLSVARMQRGLQSPLSRTTYLLLAGGGTACSLLPTRVSHTCAAWQNSGKLRWYLVVWQSLHHLYLQKHQSVSSTVHSI